MKGKGASMVVVDVAINSKRNLRSPSTGLGRHSLIYTVFGTDTHISIGSLLKNHHSPCRNSSKLRALSIRRVFLSQFPLICVSSSADPPPLCLLSSSLAMPFCSALEANDPPSSPSTHSTLKTRKHGQAHWVTWIGIPRTFVSQRGVCWIS